MEGMGTWGCYELIPLKKEVKNMSLVEKSMIYYDGVFQVPIQTICLTKFPERHVPLDKIGSI
jgi:hypothetical protein